MSTCGACGQDLNPDNGTGLCFNATLCQYRVQNKQPSLGQPRFDWEFEEQRTNDLEDLVLQLVERVEKLEQARGILDRIPNREPGQQIAKAIKAMDNAKV